MRRESVAWSAVPATRTSLRTFRQRHGALIGVYGVQDALISNFGLRYQADFTPQVGDTPATHRALPSPSNRHVESRCRHTRNQGEEKRLIIGNVRLGENLFSSN